MVNADQNPARAESDTTSDRHSPVCSMSHQYHSSSPSSKPERLSPHQRPSSGSSSYGAMPLKKQLSLRHSRLSDASDRSGSSPRPASTSSDQTPYTAETPMLPLHPVLIASTLAQSERSTSSHTASNLSLTQRLITAQSSRQHHHSRDHLIEPQDLSIPKSRLSTAKHMPMEHHRPSPPHPWNPHLNSVPNPPVQRGFSVEFRVSANHSGTQTSERNLFMYDWIRQALETGDSPSSHSNGTKNSPPITSPPTSPQSLRVSDDEEANDSDDSLEKMKHNMRTKPNLSAMIMGANVNLNPQKDKSRRHQEPHNDNGRSVGRSLKDLIASERACKHVEKYEEYRGIRDLRMDVQALRTSPMANSSPAQCISSLPIGPIVHKSPPISSSQWMLNGSKSEHENGKLESSTLTPSYPGGEPNKLISMNNYHSKPVYVQAMNLQVQPGSISPRDQQIFNSREEAINKHLTEAQQQSDSNDMSRFFGLSKPMNGHGENSMLESSTIESPSSTVMLDEKHKRGPMGREQSNVQRQCQICNDNASGFHYGVWSCEGCKAFFKRSLQGPVDYVCPATNSCTIDKHRRKSCQACRLRKCLEMGMNKSTSRKEKSPRQPKLPAKRKISEPVETIMEPSDDDMFPKRIKEEPDVICTAIKKEQPVSKGEHELVETLLKIDPPVALSEHGQVPLVDKISIVSALMKLADKELVDIINWAKSVPRFVQLSLNDRVHLIESCWMEQLILGLAWRSKAFKGDLLVFAPDLQFDREKMELANMSLIGDKLFALASRFEDLKLKEEEFVVLRALSLFNAETCKLESQSKIEDAQNALMDALSHTVNRLSGRDAPMRLGNILLCLPHVRQSSINCIAYMFELSHQKDVPFGTLIVEMLQAQTSNKEEGNGSK